MDLFDTDATIHGCTPAPPDDISVAGFEGGVALIRNTGFEWAWMPPSLTETGYFDSMKPETTPELVEDMGALQSSSINPFPPMKDHNDEINNS